MARSSASVLRCEPRLSWRGVSKANHRSTRSGHEALAGVKWRWYRGRLVRSQATASGMAGLRVVGTAHGR